MERKLDTTKHMLCLDSVDWLSVCPHRDNHTEAAAAPIPILSADKPSYEYDDAAECLDCFGPNENIMQKEVVHSSITTKCETANDTVQHNLEENSNLENNKEELLSQAANVRPASVCVKQSTYKCSLCNLIVAKTKTTEKHHKQSNKHKINLFMSKQVNYLHHHMQKCPKSRLNEVICKICNIYIPRFSEVIEIHINSEEHNLRYFQVLVENYLTITDEFKAYCSACNTSFLEFELFKHITKKRHKKSVLERVHNHKLIQQKNIIKKTAYRNDNGIDNFEEDPNFVNDFTKTTFTKNIVEMSSNQQIKNTNFAIQQDNQAVATYIFMQEATSTAVSEIHQPICQPSTSTSFLVSQNDQNRATISCTSTAIPKTQGQKLIKSKNYVHWLNVNKLTPVTENNDQYHCGFCGLVMYKTALFDHCNNAVHKRNVDKMASLKHGKEAKTEAPKEYTITTGATAKTKSPDEETAKSELKVGAAIIELPQNIFYHCELCETWMPNTKTCIDAHSNNKRHLSKIAKFYQSCERKAKREERSNKKNQKNNAEPLSPEVIDENISSATLSASQRQDKLCQYCNTLIIGTELAHVNSEFHKKNATLKHEKSKNVIPIIATEHEDSYNYNIFYNEVDKPGTSTQPDIVQNTCKDVNVTRQAKLIETDTLKNASNINNLYNHIEVFGKEAYCRLCNVHNIINSLKGISYHVGGKHHQHLEALNAPIDNTDNYIEISDKEAYCLLCNDRITNSVKSLNGHMSAKRHKYLESLMRANFIVWSNGNFFCNICSEVIKDQSIFIHIETAVHMNEYERNTNQKVDDSKSNTSEFIFCTICNNYILIAKIKNHLRTTHADLTDISLYDLEKYECGKKKYKCKQCNELFRGKWTSLKHVLGERHLNVLAQAKTKVTFVEETKSSKDPPTRLMTSDSQKKNTEDDTKKYPQEIEQTTSDNGSKSPEEIFCEICKDNILVTQIRKHFKEAHDGITNMLFLDKFTLDFEDKGRNNYRCVQCDIMFYGKWNSLKHILGKDHYRFLTQPEKTQGSLIDKDTVSSKGDLTNLINNLEKQVIEQEDEHAAHLRDMSHPFDDTENISQDDNHSPVLKDRMIQKEERKGYDRFEEIEQDERSNIQQLNNEDDTNTRIVDDWCYMNDDFDDCIVFDDKTGCTANITECSPVLKHDGLIEKEARKVCDPFEEIEQDERTNIEQPKNDDKTNICIAEDWCDINDVDDYFVFDNKADTANISETSDKTLLKYADVMYDEWNVTGHENFDMGQTNVEMGQAHAEMGKTNVEMGQEKVDVDQENAEANVFELFEKTDKPKELFCKICRAIVPVSDYDINIHVNGSKHKKLLARRAYEVPNENSETRKVLKVNSQTLEILKQNFKTLDSRKAKTALCEPSTSNYPTVRYVNNTDDIAKNPYFIDKSEKETQCRLCNIVTSNTVAHKKYHLKSKIHKDNAKIAHVERKLSENKLSMQDDGFICNVCTIPLRMEDLVKHVESLTHKRAIIDRKTIELSKRLLMQTSVAT